MNLALFDFDGTVTFKDSFTQFIKFSVPKVKLIFYFPVLVILFFIYKLELMPTEKLRRLTVYVFFKNYDYHKLNEKGKKYSEKKIPSFTRNSVIDQIKDHISRGDKTVLVSASLDIYLKHWCEAIGIDLICSELEIKNNKVTGKYVNGDCSGKVKSERIMQKFDLKKFDKIFAYGDTVEDREMFELADVKYYRSRLYEEKTELQHFPDFRK